MRLSQWRDRDIPLIDSMSRNPQLQLAGTCFRLSKGAGVCALGGRGKQFPLFRGTTILASSRKCAFCCIHVPAQYNSSRTDGRFDPGVPKNTPNRSGRQITGDRMIVLDWVAPLLAMTKQERLLVWIGILAGVLVMSGVVLARIDRWRKRQMEERDDAPQHLGSFRTMFENGELSKEEYDRVLRKMAERVGAKPKPIPTPAQPPTSESPENEEPPSTPPA